MGSPTASHDAPHRIMGSLYVVGTPIGNLEDISLRALRVLRSVALIAAEDTRKTARLLSHYDIHTPLTSYFEHNKLGKLEAILGQLAQDNDVALVSEAGMPGLSDPGYELVRAVLAAGWPVVPLPGACAAITALVVSGLPTDSFLFLGFLPRRPAARRRALEQVRQASCTLLVYEAPHRLLACLADMEEILGERPVAVARELTKLHEEFFRGTLGQARQHFAAGVRGEITLVIGGSSGEPGGWDEVRVRGRLQDLLGQGLGHKQAAQQVAAESGWPRREVYRLGRDPKGLGDL
ncbi:MAG: 16S rRNA (cytidine(1402)-2'-O)-methyltransferase [Thermoflexales bacterium]|nr:16S rRNA (cytidine(1402)-2'-O)-methyltransferase [Thermoflexales bacterium]